MDDFNTPTPSTAVNQISPEERQYLQLTSLAQLGGAMYGDEIVSMDAPPVVINQAGSTNTVGTHWLMPVNARDCYEHFYDNTLNDRAYCVSSSSTTTSTSSTSSTTLATSTKPIPQQTRLYVRDDREGRNANE